MAGRDRMTIEEVVRQVLRDEHADVIRESVRAVARELMEVEVCELVGAELGERRPDDRATQRNGYRSRRWDTRVGEIELQIPRLRQGSYFPSFLAPRKRSELLERDGVPLDGLPERAEQLAAEGKTVIYVAVDGRPAGLVAAADQLRPSASAAIAGLKNLGLEVALISGDNRRTAEAVASELGIDRVFTEVLPADKAEYVKRLQQDGRRVAMVGDGVNDAPALAQADIGVAIGAGTDVAVETANVVLMRSDPLDIVAALRLSRATVRKMKQNLVWASVYNLAAIPIAAGVLFPSTGIELRPEWSALLMSASSIIVATNGDPAEARGARAG